MALQQDYTDANTGLTVPASYRRIDTVNVDDKGTSAVVIVNAYVSAADKDAGKSPIQGSQRQHSIPSALVSQVMGAATSADYPTVRDTIKHLIYLYLKTLAEYAGATDV